MKPYPFSLDGLPPRTNKPSRWERFTERYLRPVAGNSECKHGFTMMAVSCLMIESLESFRRGCPNTIRRSEAAFESFFASW